MNEIRLHNLIVKYAPLLQSHFLFYKITDISAENLLTAFAIIESSFGSDVTPRLEKSYQPSGRLFTFEQKERYDIYGDRAAKSYGPFQVMYATACELGFDVKPWKRAPELLAEPETNIHYCIEYIRKRSLARGDKQIQTIFDAYNSGTSRDNIKPLDYIRKGEMAYSNATKKDYVVA